MKKLFILPIPKKFILKMSSVMKNMCIILLMATILTGKVFESGGSFYLYANEITDTKEADKDEPDINAPSVILMEASTGTVLYEKNSKEILKPASITKIMTLNLIFEALQKGQIKLDDTVTVSEYAASMGGSQVFLEAGETQTVETMIKCISIASANDACVAMAEHICQSEEEFVRQMNEKAKALGMENTTFVNCNGLDTDGHITSARDVALMSRELIVMHPMIHDYCMTWQDNIIHETKKGSFEFGLTNTNKLIRQYQYATGLKTGSTAQAKFCLSATAKKDGVELIAVIMAAPDPKIRFQDAIKLLNYGFSKCQLYVDENKEPIADIRVKGSLTKEAPVRYEGEFKYIDMQRKDLSKIIKTPDIPEYINAPIKKDDVVGRVIYTLDGKEIGTINILSDTDIKRAEFKDYFFRLLSKFFCF